MFKNLTDTFIGKLIIASLASILVRYPTLAFFLDAADVRKMKIWDKDLEILCPGDCRIYAFLSKAYNVTTDAFFFPVFPYMVKFTRSFFPSHTGMEAAIYTSVFFTFLFGIIFLFLCEYFFQDDKKFLGFQWSSWLTLILISIYPSGHFWIQGYSEPIFAFFFCLFFLSVIKKIDFLSFLILGFLAVIKPQGIWLLAVCGSFLILNRLLNLKTKKEFFHLLFNAVIMVLPFLAFLNWQYNVTGNPLQFMHLQKIGWSREVSFLGGLTAHLPTLDILSAVLLYTSLASIFIFIRRKDEKWKLLALSCFVFADLPLFVGGYYSYVRFISFNFALFIFLAELCRHRPVLLISVLIFSITRLAIQVYHISHGIWSG